MEKVCKECGKSARERFQGEWYCKRHYLQMYRYGHCLARTIYDGNDYEDRGDYYALITYDKFGNKNGEFLIDKEDKPLVEQHKWHTRGKGKYIYAVATVPNGTRTSNQKVHLHKLIMQTSSIVDHISGNRFDNRKSNLRIVTNQKNMFNIKKNKFIGVIKMPYKKESYQAHIFKNYKDIYLGTFPTFIDAAVARLKSEKELFGDNGGQRELYHVLDTPNPTIELQRILNQRGITC